MSITSFLTESKNKIGKNKKSKKDNPIFKIKCDNREEIASQNVEMISAFHKENANLKIPIEVVVEQLNLGDYVCRDIICEIKSVKDALSSILSGDRLLDQFIRLNLSMLNDPNLQCYLCIIGNIKDGIKEYLNTPHMRKKIKTKEDYDKQFTRLRRSINAIKAKFGTYGITASDFPDKEDFAYFLLKSIQYRYIKEKESRVPQRFKVVVDGSKDINKKVSIVMLKGIPGIGDIMAERLLDYFNCLTDVGNATIEELQAVTAPMSQTPSEKQKNINIARDIFNAFRNKYGLNNYE